jgi:predicted O-methyltransferase YrrM
VRIHRRLRKARALGARGTIAAARSRLLFRGGHALERLGVQVLPVHYYSAAPSLRELRASASRWTARREFPGIDLSLDRQLATLERLEPWRAELAELPTYAEIEGANPGEGMGAVDAELLYLMVRSLGSKRVVEVGSGTSTVYLGHALRRSGGGQLTAIDPYRLGGLVEAVGEHGLDLTTLPVPVQDADLATFTELGDGDVLFIDSSHVAKTGSDVEHLVIEVLPRLAPGVHVHIHDIPFPYGVLDPNDVLQWHFFWNEWALVAAFLQFNDSFEVLVSARMLHHDAPAALAAALPSYTAGQTVGPSSLWIRRVR